MNWNAEDKTACSAKSLVDTNELHSTSDATLCGRCGRTDDTGSKGQP
jgi:hypothetical protein